MISIERPGRFTAFLCSVILLAILAGVITWRLWLESSTIQQSGDLTVAAGDTAETVWQKAVAAGFTARPLPWRYHAWRRGAETRIRSGNFTVSQGEKVAKVIERLIAGTSPAEITITYPEGFTLQQFAERTAAAGIGTVDEFIQAAAPTNYAEQFPWLRHLPPARDLEGYLFPDTYRAFADDTPPDVIKRMLATFQRRVIESTPPPDVLSRTIDQAVIMASIIEREVQSDEDLGLVAGILWQRFNDNVGLAADATVRYALDKWEGPLTVADLQVDSPYNTRRYAGLPPGPISNPGLRALLAALNPKTSEYYYYLSTPDGQTIFSRTLAEHNANKAKYLR
ncbi:MAG: endolytic transglycosylase MltG [Candidatus Andersenbacteria bacterium]|nr:endolytic transglycosylase MltG [Candidatus Andersenbacteria bacterium]